MSVESINYAVEAEKLQAAIVDLNQRIITQEEHHQKRYEQIYSENLILREKIKLLTMKIYGKSSEKYYSEELAKQLSLFGEEEKAAESVAAKPQEYVTIPEHKREKRGRQGLPAELPRIETIIDLPEAEKIHSCGRPMKKIGEKRTEKLHKKPGELYVEVTVLYQYACPSDGVDCEAPMVKIAPMPVQLLPKTIATASLVADIITAKFVDAIPCYRQEQQFQRLGVSLTRATMCNWVIKLWNRCRVMKEILFEEMRLGPVIYIDETLVQVICEEDRAATDKSHMWVSRGGPPGKPVIYFHYSPHRNSEVANQLLSGYKGIVQTDGYVSYKFLDEVAGIIHVGCWAHARRNFIKVIQAGGKKHSNGKADEILRLIKQLYQVEREADKLELSPPDRLLLRQEKSKGITDAILEILQEIGPLTAPKSLLGKAVGYASKQWPRLIKFLDNGLIRLDNNLAENAIRPFVVGRKNWLFSYTEDGVEASAFFYSLIETCKANGYEPFSYLNYFFEKLPNAITEEDHKNLLPQHIEPGSVKPLMKIK